MASSSTTRRKGSQSYPYPSQVYVANYLSIKLSGKANYGPWKEQIMCFLESLDMLDFINGSPENPKEDDSRYKKWKRSDTLVKGWIFGSLSEYVMGHVVGCHTAEEVWKKLAYTFGAWQPVAITAMKKAILSGEWKNAKDIFEKDDIELTVKMNEDEDTPIHVAISTCKDIDIVENLLKEIDPKSLPKQLTKNLKSNPLHRAAAVGNTKAAKMLVEKNQELLFKMDEKNYLPIHRAIFGSHEKTFRYLLEVSKEYNSQSENDENRSPFLDENGAVLLSNVISSGFLDVACDLIKDYPHMATKFKEDHTPQRKTKRKFSPLISIAGKLDAYHSGKSYSSYQKFIYSYMLKEEDVEDAHGTRDVENQVTSRSCFHHVKQMIYLKFEVALLNVPEVKNLQEEKLKHRKALEILQSICKRLGESSNVGEHYHDAITLALENDIPEVIEEIIRHVPQEIRTKHNGYEIIQFAILNRCEKVYNLLLHKIVVPDNHFLKVSVDEDGNGLLHLAGRLTPMDKLNLIPGAASQMQRELQWFNEVQNIVLHKHINKKNKNQETPIMVFRKEHKDLRKEGEAWMKKTADSYTITAALIITIVFAAAITVPGGNDGNTGKAIFAKRSSFIIFAISDAISLFSSTTSLLLFLSILTARYRDEDFLHRLPKRLIIGLTMLFLAVTSMMVAFSSTLYIMFGQEKGWILISIAAFTCLPIASFVTLQLPLLVDLISSTYGRGIFNKKSK